MPSNPFKASRAYITTGLETTVADASPEQLIVMLHNGLIESLLRARLALGEGRIAAKGEAISKALAILTEGLMPALDLERGGEIAGNLAALYEYMVTRLMLANLQNDVDHLDEVTRLVNELRGAWEQLAMKSTVRAAVVMPMEPVAAGAQAGLSFRAA